MNLSKLRLIIKSRSVHLPRPTRWPRIGLPRFSSLPTVGLGNRRIKWVITGSVGLSMLVVATGIYYAIYDVMANTYEWPEPGQFTLTYQPEERWVRHYRSWLMVLMTRP